MACAICETRRPRRYCPGVRGDICSICCGTEREVSVDCPLDCEYLKDAHLHERPAPVDPAAMPHQDVRVTEEFLEENTQLLTFVSGVVLNAAMNAAAIDNDVREALEALIRTYRTRESGVYYDTRPNNPYAGAIWAAVQDSVEQYRRNEREQSGMSRTRDMDVLGIFVFMLRIAVDRDNGRPRGRAFLDFLRRMFPAEPPQGEPQPPSLILP